MNRESAHHIFNYGVTGVDFFFIISGFVIYRSAENYSHPKFFIYSRISRLYPAYWACCTITFLAMVSFHLYFGTNITFVKTYLINLTMFQHYFGVENIDGPYWTLIIEMNFYILIAILLYLKKLSLTKTICLVITSLQLLVLTLNNSMLETIFFYLPIFKVVALFTAGIIFNQLYKKQKIDFKNTLYLLLCLVVQVASFKKCSSANPFMSIYEYAAITVIYFSLFYLLAINKIKFIIIKPLQFLGKISYSLYLIHFYIAIKLILETLMDKLNLHLYTAGFIFTLPLILTLAYFINKYIEIPYTKKMKQLLLKQL